MEAMDLSSCITGKSLKKKERRLEGFCKALSLGTAQGWRTVCLEAGTIYIFPHCPSEMTKTNYVPKPLG